MKTDRAGTMAGTVEALEAADPYPGLWRKCRRKKFLRSAGGGGEQAGGRMIDIDIIVASVPEWQRCQERQEGGWNEVNLDGVIIAEKSLA